MGIGISTYGEICAFGPSPATPAGGWESATVKVEPSGTVTVLTGVSPHGQGEETTFAQITADELGVGIDDISCFTATRPSSSTASAHSAAAPRPSAARRSGTRCRKSRPRCRRFGEMLLESDDVTLRGGRCVCNKIRQVGHDPADRRRRLPRHEAAARHRPGLVATRFWEPPNFAYPFGAHIAVTEIDRETGEV